jgi:transposase
MGKRGDLSDAKKSMIIGARAAGMLQKDVALLTETSQQTVSRIFLEWKRGRGIASEKHNSGRKSDISERGMRQIDRIAREDRRQTASQITQTFNLSRDAPVSVRTIRRRLKKLGLRSCALLRRPLISAKNRKDRLRWCRERRTWTVDQWKDAIWSDESRFTVFPKGGQARAWRRPNETLIPGAVSPTTQAFGGGVMVWGAFSWHRKWPLVILPSSVTSQEYLSLLEENLLPGIGQLPSPEKAFFQDDNAPIHRAKKVQNWFLEHASAVKHIVWPAQSPDLNPIEHVWALLESRIRKRTPAPTSVHDLRQALQEEWVAIPISDLRKLVHSMSRRVLAVIAAKGGNTRY